jgi:hypothetical protein
LVVAVSPEVALLLGRAGRVCSGGTEDADWLGGDSAPRLGWEIAFGMREI